MGQLEWLSNSVLADVMTQLCRSESFEVGEWSVVPAVAKGVNFTSQLHRIQVQVSQLMMSFVIKSPPNGELGRTVIDAGIWAKETAVYADTLPVLHDLLACRIAPQLLQLGPDKEIMLEDIRPRGYTTVPRTEQLDYAHCLVAMETVAKFHAASVVAMETGRGNVQFVGKEVLYCERSRAQMTPHLTSLLSCLADEVGSWPGCQKYAYDIRRIKENIFDLLKKAAEPSTHLNVLNHGDLWANNIMFKHDKTGRVKKAKLVDFQISRWTSPAHDLQYFIVSSLDKVTRETKLEEILKFYIKLLNDHLAALGSEKQLTLDILKVELRRTAIYGLYVAASTVVTKMAESVVEFDVQDDVNSTDGQTNPFAKAMRSPRYRDIMPHLLIYFKEHGVFS